MAIHRGHHELSHPERRKLHTGGTEILEAAAVRDVEGASRVAHVGAGAEGAAAAGDDDRAHRIVFVAAPIEIREL